MQKHISNLNKRILTTRRHYGEKELVEENMSSDPFIQFTAWFEEALNVVEVDPSAMVLSTFDQSGFPDSRVVLLLGLKDDRFIFYTSYDSAKAKQIEANNKAAINFYWPELSRQVRICGIVDKISVAESESYFATRDRGGQIAAHGATQSIRVDNREALVRLFKAAEKKFPGQTEVPCPKNWGGYQLTPVKYEFFQGRNSRLHDRIVYELTNGSWGKYRIAP